MVDIIGRRLRQYHALREGKLKNVPSHHWPWLMIDELLRKLELKRYFVEPVGIRTCTARLAGQQSRWVSPRGRRSKFSNKWLAALKKLSYISL